MCYKWVIVYCPKTQAINKHMKNLIAILFLLFAVFGMTHAQIDRFTFPRTSPVRPPVDLRFNCADLAVKLEIHRIDKGSGKQFRAIFKATLTNVGRRNFNNWANPAQAYLRVTSDHPNAGEDAVMLIASLRPGESRITYLRTTWSSTWNVAPSVVFSLQSHPADCNRNNNKAAISHQTILNRLRLSGRPVSPFGGF